MMVRRLAPSKGSGPARTPEPLMRIGVATEEPTEEPYGANILAALGKEDVRKYRGRCREHCGFDGSSFSGESAESSLLWWLA
jgi:hypothetical protein